MKIITVVGARPNFMKAAPIIAAIRKHNESAAPARRNSHLPVPLIDHLLVHTGQHYDAMMSDSFFADLGLPAPDIRLGVGPGSPITQTAEIMGKFEAVLEAQRPDVVIVVGDVNSTLACALATTKISFDSTGTRPLLAHVEAGLRSFDRFMPEEVNRILTDHASDLHFVTEESGIQNLSREGYSSKTIHFVGNTMIDSLLVFQDRADSSSILEKLNLRNHAAGPTFPYALLTLHRPSNVDNRETFLNILHGLEELASEHAIVFPIHPRTRQRIAEFGLETYLGMREPATPAAGPHSSERRCRPGLIPTDPLGYLECLCLMKNATIVVTDSGGIQEETTCLGVPCVTVRENTERPVTIDSGTNIIAGITQEGIKAAIRQQQQRQYQHSMPHKWDGQAAERILDVLLRQYRERIVADSPAIASPSTR